MVLLVSTPVLLICYGHTRTVQILGHLLCPLIISLVSDSAMVENLPRFPRIQKVLGGFLVFVIRSLFHPTGEELRMSLV